MGEAEGLKSKTGFVAGLSFFFIQRQEADVGCEAERWTDSRACRWRGLDAVHCFGARVVLWCAVRSTGT